MVLDSRDVAKHRVDAQAGLFQFYYCWTPRGLANTPGYGFRAASPTLVRDGLLDEVKRACGGVTRDGARNLYRRQVLSDGLVVVAMVTQNDSVDNPYFVHGLVGTENELSIHIAAQLSYWSHWVDHDALPPDVQELPDADVSEVLERELFPLPQERDEFAAPLSALLSDSRCEFGSAFHDSVGFIRCCADVLPPAVAESLAFEIGTASADAYSTAEFSVPAAQTVVTREDASVLLSIADDVTATRLISSSRCSVPEAVQVARVARGDVEAITSHHRRIAPSAFALILSQGVGVTRLLDALTDPMARFAVRTSREAFESRPVEISVAPDDPRPREAAVAMSAGLENLTQQDDVIAAVEGAQLAHLFVTLHPGLRDAVQAPPWAEALLARFAEPTNVPKKPLLVNPDVMYALMTSRPSAVTAEDIVESMLAYPRQTDRYIANAGVHLGPALRALTDEGHRERWLIASELLGPPGHTDLPMLRAILRNQSSRGFIRWWLTNSRSDDRDWLHGWADDTTLIYDVLGIYPALADYLVNRLRQRDPMDGREQKRGRWFSE